MTERSHARALRRVHTDLKKATRSNDYKAYILEDSNQGFPILYMVHTVNNEMPIYGGQTHILEVKFTNTYPKDPPKIRFVSPIVHPNVFGNGICLSILNSHGPGWEGGWSPMYDIDAIFMSLIVFLQNPQDIKKDIEGKLESKTGLAERNKSNYKKNYSQVVEFIEKLEREKIDM